MLKFVKLDCAICSTNNIFVSHNGFHGFQKCMKKFSDYSLSCFCQQMKPVQDFEKMWADVTSARISGQFNTLL